MDELSRFISTAYPYKAIIAVIKRIREWVLRCSTTRLAEIFNSQSLKSQYWSILTIDNRR